MSTDFRQFDEKITAGRLFGERVGEIEHL